MALDRKAQALSKPDHLYWLHFRTLEPFILTQLARSHAPLLDLGCGNKPYRAHYPPGEAIGVDVVQSSLQCVDVLVEGCAHLPFEDHRFETILCTQVLEHVEDPQALLAEAYRVLKPGGRMILTCPFVWELHERPHDFLRFSEYWLTQNLTGLGFHLETLERQGGDLATIGQMICLALAARRIHLPRFLQRIYNAFWAFLDRVSHSECMPLNYGLVGIKTGPGVTLGTNAPKEAA